MSNKLQKFTELVAEKLRQLLPDCNVKISDYEKNNGILLKGFIIQNGSNLTPQIYINQYYAEYKNGRTITSICNEIVSVYHRGNKEKNAIMMDVAKLITFETIKDKICLRLINYKKNESQLQNMPHRAFLDLAIIYVIPVNLKNVAASIKVTNSLLEQWNVEEETLYNIALQNTKDVNTWTITPMKDIFLNVIEEHNADDIVENIKELFESPLHVITNEQNMFGAAALLYTEVFQKLSAQLGNCNLYILPSSVNELIALEECKELSPKDLIQMVREINDNANVVDPQEVLGENIYFYDAKSNNLRFFTLPNTL